MLDELFAPIFHEIYGKALPAALEEITGITAKTWRSPEGPKRPSTIEKGLEHMSEWMVRTLQEKGGYSPIEAAAMAALRRSQLSKGGYLTALVCGFHQPERFVWPVTEALALRLDAQALQLTELRKANDFDGFRQTILESWGGNEANSWSSELEEFASALKSATNAKIWSDLVGITAFWGIHATYRFLACWDVEFQSVYLTDTQSGRGLAPQPVFLLVAPSLRPGIKARPDATYSSRGLFHLPLRRLLNLSFCLAHYHKERKWPPKRRVTRTFVAAAGGPILQGEEATEQPLAKIYKGSRKLTAHEFSDVWVSMCGKNEDGISPMPPWPCYVAAQMWTRLFIVKSSDSNRPGAVSLTVQDPNIYHYWWDHYYQEAKAKSTHFGNISWPSYLANG